MNSTAEQPGGVEPDPAADQPSFHPGSAAAGTRARVVIVGAGFGGLACARKLDRTAVDVTLFDRNGYHLFTPLLYQVATALLNPSDIVYPLRTIFRRSPNVRFQQAAVLGVDFQRRLVHLSTGHQVPYDYLVLATGSTNNYFGNRRVAEASIGLKKLDDATRLRNHVLACLERADQEDDPDERKALLTFVVVGGGPTGVEYSGALAELLQLVTGKDYPSLSRAEVRILLIEGQDRLLGAFSERLARYADRVLTRRGIEVRTGQLVKAAHERSVALSDGSVISARTIVWSAGVRPVDPLGDSVSERGRSGRLEVDDGLRVQGASGVYAIGDVAGARKDGTELPMLSAPAMQAGRYVSRAILADLQERSQGRPFRYLDKGTMAIVARGAAIAHLRGGLELTGFLGWLVWLFVHIWYLVGFRNRVMALIGWGWNYLRFDRPIRIILQTAPDPLVTRLGEPSSDA